MKNATSVANLVLLISFGLFLIPESESPRHIPQPGALEALNFWTVSRAYPYDDIPVDRYLAAFEYSRTRFRDDIQMNVGVEWQSIGPRNDGGRMISAAYNPLNPNTVFVGSASGGLWRSNNGGIGGDWQRVPTGSPVLGVMTIAIDPIDTNNIYIGTGETYRYQGAVGGTVIRTTRGSYGIGILKSTDGGQNWTRVLDWTYALQRGVQMIRVNPINPRTIFAATSEGVYKSTDAGATWDSVLAVLMAVDILIHPQDTNLVLATCGNFATPGAGLYRSTSGGESWSQVMSFPQFSGKSLLDMYASSPNVVYASVADSTTGVGGLWRSTNFGETWSLVNSSTPAGVQGWYSHFVAVHPTDSTQIIWGGVNILKSTNGGLTFSSTTGSYYDHHHFGRHPTNPNVVLVANDDGIYRSTNFGATYINATSGLVTLQFYSGFSNSQSDSLLGLGQVQDHIPGYMYRGFLIWSRSAADECGWTAINPLNDSIMYAGTRSGGTLRKSTNRGTSFSTSGSFGGFGAWNSPFVISPSNPNILYFGKDKVYRSTNAAGTWVATNSNLVLDGNPSLSMAISGTNPDTVYVGMAPFATRAHIFRTSNGGTSWTDVTGSLPDRYPNDIAVDPNDSRTLYVVFGGFGTGHVFKSTNAGISWTNITNGLPDVPTTAVMVDPQNSNYIYVGNDITVYVSTDGGSTWSAFNSGLPEAILVSDLTMTASNRTIRVSTHGNGVFQRRMLQPLGTGQWFTRSPLPTPRQEIPHAVLNGKIYIPGGLAAGGAGSTVFEMFDPTTNTWSTLAPLPEPLHHLGFAAANGRLYTIGGYVGSSFTPTNRVYEYLPDSNIWRQKTSMPAARGAHVALTLNGKIYAVGGIETGVGVSQRNDEYDPVGDSWQTRASMPTAREHLAGAVIDSLVYIAGGRVGSSNRNTLEAYSPATNTWYTRANMPTARGGLAAAAMNGRLYVFGGEIPGVFEQNEEYDPMTDIWRTMAPMPTPRHGIGSATVGDSIFIIGGAPVEGLGVTNVNEAFTLSPITTAEENNLDLPVSFRLFQNYPNPFNPITEIRFDLLKADFISLKIYDVLGREVATLVNEHRQAGTSRVTWDASTFPSGVYLYRLTGMDFTQTKKMLLIK